MTEYIVDIPSIFNRDGVFYPDEWDDPMPVYEEIVRCRDCEHFATNIHGSYCKKSITTLRNPDGFCAWGVRREP